MCTPAIALRPDGKGFMVQRGGVWWEVWEGVGGWYADGPKGSLCGGSGPTILEAVDAALATLSRREDKEKP